MQYTKLRMCSLLRCCLEMGSARFLNYFLPVLIPIHVCTLLCRKLQMHTPFFLLFCFKSHCERAMKEQELLSCVTLLIPDFSPLNETSPSCDCTGPFLSAGIPLISTKTGVLRLCIMLQRVWKA